MILDSSAVVAIMTREPDDEILRHKMFGADFVAIAAPTLVETAIVLSARTGQDARGILARFIEENQIIVLPFTEDHYGVAVTAWLKFGKGRHAAGLNFGDCMSYAVAKMGNTPLLCVGNDFSHTDLILA